MYLGTLDRRGVRQFGTLAGLCSILVMGIIALGSAVRAADAGLSCPDWPLCFHKVIPIFDTRVFLEWFHRLLAGSLSLLLLGATVHLVREATLRRVFAWQLGLALLLLAWQVILGGLTVLKLLNPAIVAGHLVNAVLLLSVLISIFARSRYLLADSQIRYPVPPIFRRALFLFSSGVLVQVLLGGLVSSHHAGVACPDFPTCFGKWIPPSPMLLPVWLQMLHRIMAGLLLLSSIALNFMAARIPLPGRSRLVLRILPLMLIAQIALGITNVFRGTPLWASVTHSATAEIIYATSFILALHVQNFGRSFADGFSAYHKISSRGKRGEQAAVFSESRGS